MGANEEYMAVLSGMKLEDTCWVATQACDVYVTRVSAHAFDFAFGIRKSLTMIQHEMEHIMHLPLHTSTCDMCDLVEPQYSVASAAEYLAVLMSASRCENCDLLFTGYTPNAHMCTACYLLFNKHKASGKSCVICLTDDCDLLKQTVVVCPTCQQIVCHACSKKLTNDVHGSVTCPHCRSVTPSWFSNSVVIN